MQIAIKSSNQLFKGVFFLLLLSSCSRDEHDHPANMTGQQLFKYHCAGCHMENGTGKFLKGVPANSGTQLSITQITHKVVKGEGSNVRMPSFPNMQKTEAAKIAAYLKQMPAVNLYQK